MDVDQIFSKLAIRLIEGTMFHEQLMNSYLFLGLEGYSKCHEYHYLCETCDYISLTKYYTKHFNKLINPTVPNNPEITPESWLGNLRSDVDPNMRAQAMEAALKSWIDWETDTKRIYLDAYSGLFSLCEIDAAEFVKDYICDVEKEIVYAENELLKKKAMNFDIVSIIEEQESFKKKFQRKIRRLN